MLLPYYINFNFFSVFEEEIFIGTHEHMPLQQYYTLPAWLAHPY